MSRQKEDELLPKSDQCLLDTRMDDLANALINGRCHTDVDANAVVIDAYEVAIAERNQWSGFNLVVV